MGVVDHQGVVAGGRIDFQTALDLDGVQGIQNRLLGDAQMTAEGDGGQGVVNGEVTGNVHMDGIGVTGHDLFQVVGVSVGDADLTVAEKHPLALDVFLHALMLAGADVIRFQIGEDGIVVLEACHTAELHSLARHLHDHIADASLHHLRKIFLHQEGFRRGVQGRDVLVTDDGFDGADQAGGQAGLF